MKEKKEAKGPEAEGEIRENAPTNEDAISTALQMAKEAERQGL